MYNLGRKNLPSKRYMTKEGLKLFQFSFLFVCPLHLYKDFGSIVTDKKLTYFVWFYCSVKIKDKKTCKCVTRWGLFKE